MQSFLFFLGFAAICVGAGMLVGWRLDSRRYRPAHATLAQQYPSTNPAPLTLMADEPEFAEDSDYGTGAIGRPCPAESLIFDQRRGQQLAFCTLLDGHVGHGDVDHRFEFFAPDPDPATESDTALMHMTRQAQPHEQDALAAMVSLDEDTKTYLAQQAARFQEIRAQLATE